MTKPFPIISRILHWLMAFLLLAMLMIGISMVASLGNYNLLVSFHRPLGMILLALVIIRVINRFLSPPPPLPADLPFLQRAAAHLSHLVLYGLMFALPIVGWLMVSASGYPLYLTKAWVLPPLIGVNPLLYAKLRYLHTILAFALFFTFLTHISAALFHGLIRKDGVFSSMATFKK